MEALDVVVSLLIPVLVEVMTKRHWSDSAKTAVSLVTSLMAGFFTVWLLGYDFNSEPANKTVVAILIATQTAYHKFWKPIFDKLREAQAIRDAVKKEEGVNDEPES